MLIQSALSRLSIWTQADLERLLMMAERLKLDPLNNEIYAIETQADASKKSHIVLVVGLTVGVRSSTHTLNLMG